MTRSLSWLVNPMTAPSCNVNFQHQAVVVTSVCIHGIPGGCRILRSKYITPENCSRVTFLMRNRSTTYDGNALELIFLVPMILSPPGSQLRLRSWIYAVCVWVLIKRVPLSAKPPDSQLRFKSDTLKLDTCVLIFLVPRTATPPVIQTLFRSCWYSVCVFVFILRRPLIVNVVAKPFHHPY